MSLQPPVPWNALASTLIHTTYGQVQNNVLIVLSTDGAVDEIPAYKNTLEQFFRRLQHGISKIKGACSGTPRFHDGSR